MLPTIQIKNNFLTKKELHFLKSNINKFHYEPVMNKINFAFRHFFKEDLNNKWLFDKIKKQFFPNINLKVNNASYTLRHNHTKVLSHKDPHAYNFLLFLNGKELVYNGTGFYHKKKLHTYLGFIENRALFFDGKNNLHTDLQALGESSPRYTINIFYDK